MLQELRDGEDLVQPAGGEVFPADQETSDVDADNQTFYQQIGLG